MTSCFKHVGFLTIVLLGAAVPALANINYVCDASFATFAPVNTCSMLNGAQVSGVYSGIFSNVNANIYITFGATGIGESTATITPVSYSTYLAALTTSTGNPTGLPLADPLDAFGNTNEEIDVTAALASALGLAGSDSGMEADQMTPCTLSPSNTSTCFNGVITVTDNGGAGGGFYFPQSPSDPTDPTAIDFFSIVEHETDEILGTISCISGNDVDGCNPLTLTSAGGPDASPADLFRYASQGVRTFLNASDGTTPAYFSIDGGATDIADYINSPGSGDYGDWITVYPYLVQDAEGPPDANLDIATDAGVNANHYPQPEVAVLNAVGFSLNSSAPEPGTLALFGAGLVLLGIRARQRRS